MLALQPTLAAPDIGGLIAIAFLIISFIGWLSNLVSAQQKGKAPAQRRPQRPKDRSIRDEIDAFLEEATGKQERRPPKPKAAEKVLSADDVELVDQPPKRVKRPKPQRQTPSRPNAPASVPAVPMAPPLPRVEVAGRPARTNSVFATSLSTNVGDRFGVQSLPAASAGGDASAPLGAGSPSMMLGQNQTLYRPPTRAGALLTLLREPGTVHQAVILGEILGKPRSLRR